MAVAGNLELRWTYPFEHERGGRCSVDSQLTREKQDLSTLLSDSKARVPPVHYSVLHTEGAQYMFAVCAAVDGIP